MTATSAPFGLRPARHANGGEIRYEALQGGIATGYASNIATGDLVKAVTAGGIQLAAAGDTSNVGVFAGCQYVDAAGNVRDSAYWPGGTTATGIIAYAWMDPAIIYNIQANGSLAATAVWDEADIVVGTANTLTGQSATTISTSLAGAGNSAQLRIRGLAKYVNNDWGDAYTVVEAQINETLGVVPNTNAI